MRQTILDLIKNKPKHYSVIIQRNNELKEWVLRNSKLESEKFDALMGNLTHKFYFKTSTDEELETSCLLSLFNTFEYISSQDSFKTLQISTPLYIDLKQKIAIESKYQKKHFIVKDYAYEFYKKPFIVEFVPRLFKDKKLILVHTKTFKEQIIDSISLQSIVRIDSKVNSLFDEIAKDIDEDIQKYREYELENEWDDDEDDELDIASSF